MPNYTGGRSVTVKSPSVPSFVRMPAVKSPSVPSFVRMPAVKSPSVPSFVRMPAVKSPSVPSFVRMPAVKYPSVPSFVRMPAVKSPSVPSFRLCMSTACQKCWNLSEQTFDDDLKSLDTAGSIPSCMLRVGLFTLHDHFCWSLGVVLLMRIVGF